MNTALAILLGLVAIICFLGGTNLMWKGAMPFLPEGTPPQLVLDDLVRFLAGIYLGGGFLLAYAALHVGALGGLLYCLGIMVLFSGLGRYWSRIKLGSAGRYFDVVMVVEVLLGAAIITLVGLR
ncbi:MAG TPA: DUF4345 family protein [Flavobacteriales bacterium]|nr:DUF4345 family protein [Flavobacteriales bacterium]HRP81767.1 DUF4345 family protein [Flavobacteriales bacterium]HRQ83916.1 DUF4345 family protein [Flavobacteriales bacterium]